MAARMHHKQRPIIDDLNSLRAFVSVVDAGSFSEAGRRLRVVPSTISKHIAALEDRVNGQLVVRSTKQLSITELGRRFYERCTAILSEIEEAENEIGDYNAEPQGLLRISAATVFTSRHMAPILLRFLRKYPKVKIDISLSTSSEDIVADGIDVAIRISSNLDQGLIALKLAPNIRVYCAAPSYLAEYGTPASFADLANHNCLVVRGVSQSARWPIRSESGMLEYVQVEGTVVSDNGDLIRQALLGGMGIGHLARFMVEDHIQRGELVELFPESRIVASNIYAVYAQRKNLPLKTRAFLDHLREEFRIPPAWAEGGDKLPVTPPA